MQHVKRWVTALILSSLLLWILFKGSLLVIIAVVCMVAVFAIREYFKIIFGDPRFPVPFSIKLSSHIISILMIMGAGLKSPEVTVLIMGLTLIVLAVFVLSGFSRDQSVLDSASKQLLGIVYIPLPLSLLIYIRQMEGGIHWIVWLLIVIFANDTGAFYTGTFLGKRPLAPRISPKKTIEGSLGGILASLALGFVFCFVFFKDLSLCFLTLPLSFILAVSGQVGDLFESAMKRASGIKDSGRILPGHGGMLDRIDGLLPAIPILYAYLVLF